MLLTCKQPAGGAEKLPCEKTGYAMTKRRALNHTILAEPSPGNYSPPLPLCGRGRSEEVEIARFSSDLHRAVRAFIPAILAAIFLCMPISAAQGQELSGVEGAGVRVLYHDPSLEMKAREVIRYYPFIEASLESVFLWEVDFRPDVLLVGDRRDFLQMAGHEAFVAYAVPERQLVVIDCTQMDVRPFTLETTLKHELCHLLLHRHIAGVHLPKWLDEGICQWVSEGIPEIIMSRRGSPLSSAVLTGTLIHLESLSRHFPRDSRGLSLAYEQSRSVVEYIIRTYGVNGMLNILQSMKNGTEADDALEMALMTTRHELEESWHEDLRSWPVLLAYFAGNLYTVLFILGAVLTLVAYIRFLVRKRRYRDQEEQDQENQADGQE